MLLRVLFCGVFCALIGAIAWDKSAGSLVEDSLLGAGVGFGLGAVASSVAEVWLRHRGKKS